MTVFEAIVAGDVERVKELVQKDPGVAMARDEQGLSPILQAKYQRRDELVPVLREATAELDFFEACAVGDPDRVEELVEADPTLVRAIAADGFFGLALAAFFGHADVARLLIERRADVNRRSEHEHLKVTPLHAAASGGHPEIVRMLLDAGADVNATQPGGFTALMSAAQNGDAALVELLLARGGDPAARTEEGRTAADFARDAGHADLADGLVQR
jgi:ankyrin repeat protein